MNRFTHCSGLSIIDFEQVNAGWESTCVFTSRFMWLWTSRMSFFLCISHMMELTIKREVTKVLVHRTCATGQLKIFHTLKHGLLKVGHESRYYISLIDVAQNLTFITSLSEIFLIYLYHFRRNRLRIIHSIRTKIFPKN